MTIPVDLDHLVYAVPDLEAGVRAFAARTGVNPAEGGRHAGFGTANYLVGLGPGRYLEIIGPDPDQPNFSGRRLFGISADGPAALVTWAAATTDIDALISSARTHGYDAGDSTPLSRLTAGGGLLQWRLTPDTVDSTGGTVPFLIDWLDSAHPSLGPLPQLRLISFTLTDSDPARLRAKLAALETSAAIESGPRPALTAVFGTPNGDVALT